MAAPIPTNLCAFTNVLLTFNRSRLFGKSVLFVRREYYSSKSRENYGSRQKHLKPKDPRHNVQYPYFRGDPIHEINIKELDLDQDAPPASFASRTTRSNNKKTITGSKFSSSKDGYKQDLNESRKQNEYVDYKKKSHFITSHGLSYRKLKDGDIRFGRTILSIKSKMSVDSSKMILLEGQRLIKDSLLLGAKLKCLYFSDESLLNTLPSHLLKNVDLFKVLYRDLKTWMDTKTPAGILGIFNRPDQGVISCYDREDPLPLTLILDGVKDPGNAGTLIRTAAAIGCDKILAVKGCVNMWEGKVLRSGMGSHFAIPIYTNLDWSQVYNHVSEKSYVFLAEPSPSDKTNQELGSYVQLQNYLEYYDELDNVNESDSGNSSDISDDDSDTEAHSSDSTREMNSDSDSLFHKVPFPSSLYCDVNLQSPRDKDSHSQNVTLIVGGETTGLSAAAKKFAYEYYGQFVTLPMTKHIDSLNNAVAGSVILYEFKRKLENTIGSLDSDKNKGP